VPDNSSFGRHGIARVDRGSGKVGALSLNGIGWTIARLPEIGGTMRSTTVQWSGTATAFLVAELALIAFMLLITFFVQSRKRDFL
jgi:hypothetical protein